MDSDVTEPMEALYDDEVQFEEQNEENMETPEDMEMTDKVCSNREAHELKPSIDDSSAGKLFGGGIACETTKESFRKHFSQFGEVTNSVIMVHKTSGWPRGFGFVTYADPEIADKVLEEDHIIDGRAIMLDQTTGRPRGFGFVRFDKEKAVEKVLSNGHMHELCSKQVEIKRAEPKRAGAEHTSESWLHCCGCDSKSYGGGGGPIEVFGGGYGGNMGSGYGGYGRYEGYGDYGRYGKFAGSYGVGPTGFYPGYGYGFWFGEAMYGAAGYWQQLWCACLLWW